MAAAQRTAMRLASLLVVGFTVACASPTVDPAGDLEAEDCLGASCAPVADGKADGPGGVPVLMYHDVRPVAEEGSDVALASFLEQARFLAGGGFSTMSLDAWFAYKATGTGLPARPVVLTFDDGYEGNCRNVPAVLRAYGLTATFFVHTAYVGETTFRGHCSWEQLAALEKEGLIAVESHTVRHPKLPTLSAADIDSELVDSRAAIEQHLGHPARFLAYPYGAATKHVAEAAERAGYDAAFVIGNRSAHRDSPRYLVPRITVAKATTMKAYRAALGGAGAPGRQRVVIDVETAAGMPDGWRSSASEPGYLGVNYWVAPAGTATEVGWQLGGVAAGRYELFVTVSPAANRSTRARYRVRPTAAAAAIDVWIDQRTRPWASLGTYELSVADSVSLDPAEADGFTVADALVAVPID